MRFSGALNHRKSLKSELYIQCIATAAIHAARSANSTSAKPSASRAGATASATMAACCSSTCATITASPRLSPIPTARPSRMPRSCARNGWCGSTARCASVRAEPRTRNCRPAWSRFTFPRSRCSGPAGDLPMPVFGDQEYPEEIRLKYRFLDLRRERLHKNIMLRGQVIDFDPPPDEGGRLLRIPDADPDGIVAGRRARLSRALAHPSGKILRAAAGAAAIQAADHGVGLRPLFPDRALLPRRGCARRPFAGRILSARSGDELRHAAGRVRGGRAGDARRVRGIRRTASR